MKITVLVTCLSAALMSSLAFASEPDTREPHGNKLPADESFADESITIESAASGMGSTQTVTTIGPNSEAIAILTVVNDHEVKAAEMALAKNPSAAVAEYARMLKDEHSSNQEKTRSIAEAGGIAQKGTPAVDALKAKSMDMRQELSALQDEAFESAFIKAMVQDHVEVLAKIDGELLPKATDSEVLRHLHETRTHIAMHLEMAKRLDGSRQASR